MKKLNILIDSDVANEIDDRFALAYALSRPKELNVLGITIAPFRVDWQKNLSIRDGLIDSKNEAYRILRLFGIKHDANKPLVYLGCDGFLSEGYNITNPAVEKIISIAKRRKELCICCLGTLTNVAMAIRLAPEIAPKLKVVWIGTDNLVLDKFEDLNFAKDVEAFYEVLASSVDFTIFPTYLARTFITSTYEFSRNIKSNNVTKYLNSLLDKFVFTEENMGIKTVYDIGPVAYLLNKDEFLTKQVSADLFLKNVDVTLPQNRMVNYVSSVPKNNAVWADFLHSVNSVKNHYIKPKIFFTSDTHFGCQSKITRKLVPFKSVEEMDCELVKRWNNKVGENDVVYHLGDFGTYEMIKKLNGKVVLVCGNYEAYDYGKDFESFRAKLLALGFADVVKKGMYLDEKVLGEKVYLTHKPTDHAKDCLTIFGHVHSLGLVKKFGFNVCVTYHYFAPIDVDTVKRYLRFVKQSADEDVFV